jgi:hypothetical protein
MNAAMALDIVGLAKVEKLAYAEAVELYDKLVKSISGLERKGKTLPYTSVNGNMFTYISKSGSMAIRLPKEARDQFLKKYKTKLHEAYGILQKEYATVPDALLLRTGELKQYVEVSYAYAKALKPKPSKRKD